MITRRKLFNFCAAPVAAVFTMAGVRELAIPYPKTPPYYCKVGEGNWFTWMAVDMDTGEDLEGITEIDCVIGYAHQYIKPFDGAQRIIRGNFKLEHRA